MNAPSEDFVTHRSFRTRDLTLIQVYHELRCFNPINLKSTFQLFM